MPTYERFLEKRLEPGGAIILHECTRDRRTRKVADRVYFQFGALGGVSAGEYHDSGDRIAHYLQREGSPDQRWTPPGPYRAAWSSTSWLPARSP